MVDGVKIDCIRVFYKYWLENPLLDFPLMLSEKTGEILHQTRTARHNGLSFKITPSHIQPGLFHSSIEGSLHKYWNEGKHNVNDFGYSDIVNVIQELSNGFDFKAFECDLINMEFGVNISLPVTAKHFINSLVCLPEKKFSSMNIEKIKLGKVCSKSDYEIKFYDKGEQSKTGVNNLIRIEIKVKRMRHLTPFGIKKLSDLADKTKIEKLGQLLLNTFSEVIFYDNSIKQKILTPPEKLIFANYINPLFWENCNRSARYKHRKKYENLLLKLNANGLKTAVENLIFEKWNELLNKQPRRRFPHDSEKGQRNENPANNSNSDKYRSETAQKTGLVENVPGVYGLSSRKSNIYQNSKSRQKATFVQHECSWKTSLFTPKEKNDFNNPSNMIPEALPKTKKCKTCGRDISHQKQQSIFCSEKYFGKEGKKCRVKASGLNRTEKKRQKREFEKIVFFDCVSLLPENIAFVELEYFTGERIKINNFNELTKIKPLRNVKKSIIHTNGQTRELTSLRAREFIKLLIMKQKQGLNYTNKLSLNTKNEKHGNRRKKGFIY